MYLKSCFVDKLMSKIENAFLSFGFNTINENLNSKYYRFVYI